MLKNTVDIGPTSFFFFCVCVLKKKNEELHLPPPSTKPFFDADELRLRFFHPYMPFCVQLNSQGYTFFLFIVLTQFFTPTMMQRCLPTLTGQRAFTRSAFSSRSTLAAQSMLAAVLTISTRCFVQGAPPVPKKDIDPKRKAYLRSSHADEMEDKYKRRQREIHEYFATHEPNCPEPLEENAFVKGKFGMRRRYYVDHRGKLDAMALNDAIAESTNAMRK